MDKAYLRRVLLSFLAALFSVALILYVGYHIRRFLTKDVATVPAREVEQNFTVRCDGYIFRKEETIIASSAGTLAASVSDGTHVHVGEEVAAVYSVSDPQAEANLRAMREQLSLLRDYAATNRGAKDAAAVDSRIYSILSQMKTLAARNDLAGVCEMRSELLAELNERDVASGVSDGNFDTLIASVESSIAAETAKLGSLNAIVTAPRAGWYYSAADGFESAFDPDILDSLTVPAFEKLITEPPASTQGCGGKLALDFEWFLAIELGSDDAALLKEGDETSVSFAYNGGASLPMEVRRVVNDPDSDKSLVVLSCGEVLPGFSFARCQTVDVAVESLAGFPVPRSAVRLVDGQLGVYTFDGVYANFRRIVVLREFEDEYLVKTDTAIEAEEAAKAAAEEAQTDKSEANSDSAKTKSEKEAQEQSEAPFDASKAPYLSQNDLIVVEGKEMYEGKIIS